MAVTTNIRHPSRRQFLTYMGAASGATLLAACTAPMLTIQQPATVEQNSEGETTLNTVNNIVLVHGAWADGSSWSSVIQILQAQGYQVTAVQIPLSSIADDVARTRQVLAAQDGPTILVGHSYGGVVIGELGADAPNVAALVYVAAFAFDEGQSVQGLLAGGAPPSLASIHPDEQGYLWFEAEGFVKFFAADVDPIQANVMAAVQKPIAAQIFDTAVGVPAWRTLPSWYLIAEDDQIIPPPAQQAMAEHIGATITTSEGSHVVFISHPQVVADLIVTVSQEALIPA